MTRRIRFSVSDSRPPPATNLVFGRRVAPLLLPPPPPPTEGGAPELRVRGTGDEVGAAVDDGPALHRVVGCRQMKRTQQTTHGKRGKHHATKRQPHPKQRSNLGPVMAVDRKPPPYLYSGSIKSLSEAVRPFGRDVEGAGGADFGTRSIPLSSSARSRASVNRRRSRATLGFPASPTS